MGYLLLLSCKMEAETLPDAPLAIAMLDSYQNQTDDALMPESLAPQQLKRPYRTSSIGAPLPLDLQLKDVDGRDVDLKQFVGHYMYIDVWASWCAPCRREIPFLKALEEKTKREDIVFISVSVDENRAAWQRAIREENLTGNQYIDSNGSLARALKVEYIPFFVIYDKEGRLYRYNAPRPSSAEEIAKVFDEMK